MNAFQVFRVSQAHSTSSILIYKCHQFSFLYSFIFLCWSFLFYIRKSVNRMSGGIARGRLAEERKTWRKNHPHVSFVSFAAWLCENQCFPLMGFDFYALLFIFCLFGFFRFLNCHWKILIFRVLWRDPRRVQMARLIWWCGIASSLVNQMWVEFVVKLWSL